jgi:hypothetical protein
MLGNQDNYSNWRWDIDAELKKINKRRFKEDNTSPYDYAQKTRQQGSKISSDLSKKFFSNGSELKFNASRSLPVLDERLFDNTGYRKDKNTTEYLNNLSVSWKLPLIKNKNGIIDQKTYDFSVLEYDDEKLILAEVQEDFIKKQVNEFIEWVGYAWKIVILKDTIVKLSNILVEMKIKQAEYKNSNNDRRKNKEIIEIENRNKDTLKNYINNHKRLLLSFQSKLKAQNILLLSAVNHLDLDKNIPKLTRKFSFNLIDNLDKYCRTTVRDIKRINIEIIKNNRSIKTSQNANLANLDFTVNASRYNNKGNYTSYSKSSKTEYEARLDFKYILSGNVSNQVSLDKYQLKSRQLELKYNNKLDDIISSAKKIATNINQGQIQLILIKEQLQVLKPNKLELKNQGDMMFIINKTNDYQDLQLEEIDILIDLYKDKLKYDSLLDRLLPKDDLLSY